MDNTTGSSSEKGNVGDLPVAPAVAFPSSSQDATASGASDSSAAREVMFGAGPGRWADVSDNVDSPDFDPAPAEDMYIPKVSIGASAAHFGGQFRSSGFSFSSQQHGGRFYQDKHANMQGVNSSNFGSSNTVYVSNLDEDDKRVISSFFPRDAEVTDIRIRYSPNGGVEGAYVDLRTSFGVQKALRLNGEVPVSVMMTRQVRPLSVVVAPALRKYGRTGMPPSYGGGSSASSHRSMRDLRGPPREQPAGMAMRGFYSGNPRMDSTLIPSSPTFDTKRSNLSDRQSSRHQKLGGASNDTSPDFGELRKNALPPSTNESDDRSRAETGSTQYHSWGAREPSYYRSQPSTPSYPSPSMVTRAEDGEAPSQRPPLNLKSRSKNKTDSSAPSPAAEPTRNERIFGAAKPINDPVSTGAADIAKKGSSPLLRSVRPPAHTETSFGGEGGSSSSYVGDLMEEAASLRKGKEAAQRTPYHPPTASFSLHTPAVEGFEKDQMLKTSASLQTAYSSRENHLSGFVSASGGATHELPSSKGVAPTAYTKMEASAVATPSGSLGGEGSQASKNPLVSSSAKAGFGEKSSPGDSSDASAKQPSPVVRKKLDPFGGARPRDEREYESRMQLRANEESSKRAEESFQSFRPSIVSPPPPNSGESAGNWSTNSFRFRGTSSSNALNEEKISKAHSELLPHTPHVPGHSGLPIKDNANWRDGLWHGNVIQESSVSHSICEGPSSERSIVSVSSLSRYPQEHISAASDVSKEQVKHGDLPPLSVSLLDEAPAHTQNEGLEGLSEQQAAATLSGATAAAITQQHSSSSSMADATSSNFQAIISEGMKENILGTKVMPPSSVAVTPPLLPVKSHPRVRGVQTVSMSDGLGAKTATSHGLPLTFIHKSSGESIEEAVYGSINTHTGGSNEVLANDISKGNPQSTETEDEEVPDILKVPEIRAGQNVWEARSERYALKAKAAAAASAEVAGVHTLKPSADAAASKPQSSQFISGDGSEAKQGALPQARWSMASPVDVGVTQNTHTDLMPTVKEHLTASEKELEVEEKEKKHSLLDGVCVISVRHPLEGGRSVHTPSQTYVMNKGNSVASQSVGGPLTHSSGQRQKGKNNRSWGARHGGGRSSSTAAGGGSASSSFEETPIDRQKGISRYGEMEDNAATVDGSYNASMPRGSTVPQGRRQGTREPRPHAADVDEGSRKDGGSSESLYRQPHCHQRYPENFSSSSVKEGLDSSSFQKGAEKSTRGGRSNSHRNSSRRGPGGPRSEAADKERPSVNDNNPLQEGKVSTEKEGGSGKANMQKGGIVSKLSMVNPRTLKQATYIPEPSTKIKTSNRYDGLDNDVDSG